MPSPWMRLCRLLPFAAALLLAACGGPDQDEAPRAYVLPNTEVFDLASDEIGQTYEIRVALPDGYGEEEETTDYPLLVLLDADYSFAIARNLVQHLYQRGQLPKMIIVGIAYPGAADDRDLYRLTRSRDYTPLYSEDDGYGAVFQAASGGGPAFLRFIADDLLPELNRRYTIDPEDRTLSGHSYGGLFTNWALLTRPDLFARWIAVSPSLWYRDGFIFDYENSYSVTNTTMNEVVFFGAGSWENQPENNRPMVDQMNRMVEQLREHDYAGLSLDSYVFPDETHASIWPAAISRGLRSVFHEPLPGEAEDMEEAEAEEEPETGE